MLNVVRLKNHAKMNLYTREYFHCHAVFSFFSIIIKVEMNKNEFLKLNINIYIYIIYIIPFEKNKKTIHNFAYLRLCKNIDFIDSNTMYIKKTYIYIHGHRTVNGIRTLRQVIK